MGTVRLLLAVSVVVTHYGESSLLGFQFVDGLSAVEAFFAISGFFITLILNENPAYRDPGKFYLSRYTRLLPTYAVIVILSLSLTSQLAWYGLTFRSLQFPTQIFIVLSNLSLFFQDWFYLLQINYETGALEFTPNFLAGTKTPLWQFLVVPQAWSLGVEVVFYVMSPFIARSPVRLAALLLLSAGCRYLFYILGLTEDPWPYRTTAGEMMLFAAGGLSYFAGRGLVKEKPGPLLLVVALGGWIAIILLCAARNLVFAFPAVVATYPLLYEPLVLREPVFLLLIILWAPLIFLVTRNSRIDAFLGDLSYPVYLSHMLIANTLNIPYGGPAPHGAIPYVLIVIGASTALLYLVEYPVNHLRARRFGARESSKAAH